MSKTCCVLTHPYALPTSTDQEVTTGYCLQSKSYQILCKKKSISAAAERDPKIVKAAHLNPNFLFEHYW